MSTYYVAGIPYSDKLYHHGIKGQEWGVENGPPYPLGSENHSSKELKSDYKSSLNKDEKQTGNWKDKHHLTKDQKRKIAIGVAAVAAAGIMAYGLYKMKKNGSPGDESFEDAMASAIKEDQSTIKQPTHEIVGDFMSEKAKDYLNSRSDLEIDSDTGLYLKDKIGSVAEDMARVNPNFSGEKAIDLVGSYAMRNCGLCSATFDLRRRGYDVIAGLADQGMSQATVASWFKGGKFSSQFGDYSRSWASALPSMDGDNAKSVVKSLESQGESRGILSVVWGGFSSGHYVSYVVDSSGILSIVDCQNSKSYTGNDAIEFFKKVSSVDSMRTDNLVPDIELMKKVGVIK